MGQNFFRLKHTQNKIQITQQTILGNLSIQVPFRGTKTKEIFGIV